MSKVKQVEDVVENSVELVEEKNTTPINISSYLMNIGLVLNEDQIKAINNDLQFKKQRQVHQKNLVRYKRTSLEYKKDIHKLPLQAEVLITHLSVDGYNNDEWMNAVKDHIRTNQPVERIIAFYKKRLVELGLIEKI